ncbi:MAG: homocysteine S-methyltransferase family protein [Actinomycetota bacterium]
MANDIVLLDGGMGKELRNIGAPFRQPEWSALALMQAPERVAEAHRNFIDAGATVITTSNYAVVPYHLGDHRFGERGAELTALAGTLARSAADDAGAIVAGSLPPLFGSYRSDLFDPERAPELLDTIVSALAPFVDVWLAETLSSVAEIRAALAALDRHGDDRPRWVSFTLDDHHFGHAPNPALPSGESISEVAALLSTEQRVAAALINCSLPEHITPALEELRWGVGDTVRIGGYANAFPPAPETRYEANEAIHEPRPDLTPERYADIVEQWVDGGATIVGGCCDITPMHIAELARRLDRRVADGVSAR